MEQSFEQLRNLSGETDGGREVEVESFLHGHQRMKVITDERNSTGQEDVQGDAQSPDVGSSRIVRSVFENFR